MSGIPDLAAALMLIAEATSESDRLTRGAAAALALTRAEFAVVLTKQAVATAGVQEHEAFETVCTMPMGARGWLCLLGTEPLDASEQRTARALAAYVALAEEHAASGREVRAAESRYRALVEQLPGVVYYRALDAPGVPSFVSPQAEEILGFTAEELMSDPTLWRERLHPDDRARILAEQAQFDASLMRVPVRGDYRFVRKDGRVVRVQNYAMAVFDEREQAPVVLGILFDVTENHTLAEQHRELQRQLHEAQKMEALGRLAGGMAHDFNNSLTVVLSYGALVLEALDFEHPLYADVKEMLRAGERAHATTQQLLTVSRRPSLRPALVDLRAIAVGMAPMLQRLLGEDIALSIEGDDGWVNVDIAQMENVILNLAVNARDAMPIGGRLTLQIARTVLDAARFDVPAGRYVRLSVSDTGHGMDEATRARVFEPFFTTKEQGKGTGLGLPTVFGIVKHSEGSIVVESTPQRGTTFHIYLPQVDEPQAPPAKPSKREMPRGGEMVLLVEDDETVRRVTAIILGRLGYQVLEASNMAEALDRCELHDGPIHLLLTDVVMPDGNGRLLAECATELRPTLKVVFMSGYAADTLAEHGLSSDSTIVLEKPFNAPALAQTVRRALDGA